MADESIGDDYVPDIRLPPTSAPFLLKLFPVATTLVGAIFSYQLVKRLYSGTMGDLGILLLHFLTVIAAAFLSLPFGCRALVTWEKLRPAGLVKPQRVVVASIAVVGAVTGAAASYFMQVVGDNPIVNGFGVDMYMSILTWIAFPLFGLLWSGWEAYKRLPRTY